MLAAIIRKIAAASQGLLRCSLTSCGTPALRSRMLSRAEAPKADRAFRCATPHLRNGGIVLLHTDNVVEIVRGDRPER
jgi:hypothetical protein